MQVRQACKKCDLCQAVNAQQLWEDPLCPSLGRPCECTGDEQKTADTRAAGNGQESSGCLGRERPLPFRGRRAGVSEASSSGGAVPGRSGPTCSVSSDAAGRPSGRRPWSVISGALLRRGGEGIWLLLSVFVLTSICLRAQSRRLLAS